MYIMLTRILMYLAAFRYFAIALFVGSTSLTALAQGPAANAAEFSATALVAKHNSLAGALANNIYGRPLFDLLAF